MLECDRDDLGNLGTIGKSILSKRFENYNQAWISAVIGDMPSNYMSISSTGRYRANSEQEMLQDERYFNNQIDRSLKWSEDDRLEDSDVDYNRWSQY